MKKALSAFAIIVAVSIVAMLGGVFYLTGWDFAATLVKLTAILDSIIMFVTDTPILLPKIIVFVAFGLIIVVDFIVLIKIIRLRKPFVSYLTFLNIIFIALAAMLAFIPYYPDGVTPTTIPEVITLHIYTPATEIPGYVLFGAVGLFILSNLIFVMLSFVDIAKTPFPLKHTKKEKVKKNSKRKSDRDVVADEFGKFQVPVEQTIAPSPSIQEIRHAVKEELTATQRQPERQMEKPVERTPETGSHHPLTLEEIRAIIRDELERNGRGGFDSFRGAPVIYAAPWIGGFPYPAYPPQQGYYPQQQMPAPGVTGATKDDIRNVVSQELEKNIPSKKEIVTLVETEVARIAPTSKEAVYSIVNEELIKYDALNREALDSLVTEKVDKYDAINKNLIKTQLSEEISKYDTENRKAIRAIFAEELQKYDTANKEILHSIIDEELAKKSVSIDQAHRVLVGEEITKAKTEMRNLFNEELIRQEGEVKQFVVDEISRNAGPKADELRLVFAEEIKQFVASKEAAKENEPSQDLQLSREEIMQIVDEEIKAAKLEEPVKQTEITREEVDAMIDEKMKQVDVPQASELRVIFAEEIARFIASTEKKEPVKVVSEEPAAKPATENPFIKAEPALKVVKEIKKQPEPIQSVDEDDEDDSSNKIIRIPFQVRMQSAEKDLLTNYNTLKNYILSYNVKSRISNSGDTFRIHRETFVKITIAGKGLKLYFALNPQDYEGTTIPVQNVSHKAIYAEIPCVLKVKSPLSVKRAMQLVDDVMKAKGLEQGEIPNINWASDFK